MPNLNAIPNFTSKITSRDDSIKIHDCEKNTLKLGDFDVFYYNNITHIKNTSGNWDYLTKACRTYKIIPLDSRLILSINDALHNQGRLDNLLSESGLKVKM